MLKIKRFDLHPYRPTVDEALALVEQALLSARRRGYKAVKIIHGCGKIRAELPEFLRGRYKFCAGEKFELFAREGQAVLAACSELAKDRDFNKYNAGITIVVLAG
ncbi:MAG: Smr/MutS family protein [Candidatus Margulisbacteria bacterium]|nr:Smr/MutS family protein [Candidatus Margulisiibacteriota bacterium]